MKLYLLTAYVGERWEYYDSAVVASDTPEDAKTIHPNGMETSKAWESGSWYLLQIMYLLSISEKLLKVLSVA